MSLIEMPMAELNLDEKEVEIDETEDLYSHCKQRISKSGRILVSKKSLGHEGSHVFSFDSFHDLQH